MVTLLLQAGAHPDPRSHYGLTPLALAAQGGHLQVVEALLKKGWCLRGSFRSESRNQSLQRFHTNDPEWLIREPCTAEKVTQQNVKMLIKLTQTGDEAQAATHPTQIKITELTT